MRPEETGSTRSRVQVAGSRFQVSGTEERSHQGAVDGKLHGSAQNAESLERAPQGQSHLYSQKQDSTLV